MPCCLLFGCRGGAYWVDESRPPRPLSILTSFAEGNDLDLILAYNSVGACDLGRRQCYLPPPLLFQKFLRSVFLNGSFPAEAEYHSFVGRESTFICYLQALPVFTENRRPSHAAQFFCFFFFWRLSSGRWEVLLRKQAFLHLWKAIQIHTVWTGFIFSFVLCESAWIARQNLHVIVPQRAHSFWKVFRTITRGKNLRKGCMRSL